jgi:hypothetical protein
MPRPTLAHVAYGSATVVLSTFAMLLVSGARSGAAVVAIAAAGLVLGLFVALTVLLQSRRLSTAERETATVLPSSVSVPRARVASGATESRASREHSLRR